MFFAKFSRTLDSFENRLKTCFATFSLFKIHQSYETICMKFSAGGTALVENCMPLIYFYKTF
jgi:hypothetical protein